MRKVVKGKYWPWQYKGQDGLGVFIIFVYITFAIYPWSKNYEMYEWPELSNKESLKDKGQTRSTTSLEVNQTIELLWGKFAHSPLPYHARY